MPELPEVETVKRGLEPALLGRSIKALTLRRDGLRFPFPEGFASLVEGARIEALERRAKYILAHLSNGKTMLLHLGMTGRFTVFAADGRAFEPGAFYHEAGTKAGPLGPHDHVVIDLDDGTRVVYNDHRRFGLMDLCDHAGLPAHRLLKDLGVEPLGNSFNADYLASRFAGKAAPLKAALLDQRIIAGLGNIYVCEALFRAGLSPRRKAGTLVKKKAVDPRLDLLVQHVRAILAEAILAGGSTLQDFQGTNGEKGAFQQRFSVYDREGEACVRPGCGQHVKRIVQSGRSTFFCPSCQR